MIKLDPKYAAAWNNKGSALDNQGRYSEAIKAFSEAIRLDPNYSKAWYNNGSVLLGQRNYADAISCYDEAIRLDPDLAESWYNKGIALEALGKTTEANCRFRQSKRSGIYRLIPAPTNVCNPQDYPPLFGPSLNWSKIASA